MNVLKNIHLLESFLSEKDLEALDQAAYMYARHAQIYTKVIAITGDDIRVEIRQEENSAGYLDKKELIERGREMFQKFFPDRKIKVSPIPYRFPPVDVVTPEWIRKQMSKKRVSSKEIRELTGIDKGNISKWISGSRNMSQPAKAMFYLLLKDH